MATAAEPTRRCIEVTVEGQHVLGEAEVVDQLRQVEQLRQARDPGPDSADEVPA